MITWTSIKDYFFQIYRTPCLLKIAVFCHIAVPFVFLLAFYYFQKFQETLTWQYIVLLGIAFLPILLPLLAFYVEEIGKDGFKLKRWNEGPVPESFSYASQPVPSPSPIQPTQRTLETYSRPARKVLRTLWTFQRQHFNNDFSRRWAFGIHPQAQDYLEYHTGITELHVAGLVENDRRGMVFLTDAGIDFCRNNPNVFCGGGDVWETFGPA